MRKHSTLSTISTFPKLPILTTSALLILLCIFAVACARSRSEKNWTFLIYLDGDNDLAAANIKDMAEMQAGAAGDNIRILVQFDQPDGITAKRYEIKNHITIELEDIGEVNMAERQTLTDFLLWTKTKNATQADHLILILSDFINETQWDEMLAKYYQNVIPALANYNSEHPCNQIFNN